MGKYTTFSPRCSLVAVAKLMRQWEIWPVVEDRVHIKQKTVKHTPLEKLRDAFINILAGGQGLCEVIHEYAQTVLCSEHLDEPGVRTNLK